MNITKKRLLCKSCIRDPFKVERARDYFARINDSKKFISMYQRGYAEIENINTGTFWNKKFKSIEKFADQDPMTRDKISYIASLLPSQKIKLLDVAIGQAYVEQVLKRENKFPALHAIDISPTAIKRAKNMFTGTFIVEDALNLSKKYNEGTFDVVIAVELIEHITPKKIMSLLQQIKTVLKRDGLFIISTPLNEHLEDKKTNPSGHVRTYTIPILETEMKMSGFKIINLKTFYAFDRLYIIKNCLSKILRNRWEPNNIVLSVKKV